MRPRRLRWPGLVVLLLTACDADRASPSDPAPTTANAQPKPSTCAWRRYQPPPGCYLAYDAIATGQVEDVAGFAALVKPHPPESNQTACDVEAEAAALDLSQHRIFVTSVADADGVVPPEPVRVECDADVTRVVVAVDRWCGGDERGPGWMAVVVPAGATPIELINEGKPDCSGEPIVP